MLKKMQISVIGVLFVCLLAACDYTSKLNDADSYYREGEYDKALAIYSSVIKRNGKEIRALKGFADIKLAQKDYKLAIEYYKKVVEVNPKLAIRELVSLLVYSDSTIRTAAMDAIASLGNGKKEAVTEILAQAVNATQYVKIDYLEAIRKIGAPASFAAADIMKYLDFDYPQVKQKALEVLSVMDVNKIKELKIFDKMLEMTGDQDPAVAEAAVNSIAAFKSGAAGTVPLLIKVYIKADEKLAAAVKKALVQIGPASKDTIPQLVELTAPSNHKIVRIAAIDALAAMGPNANTASVDLIPLLADPDNDVKVAAVAALSKIGKPSQDSVSGFISLLKNKNSIVKLRAIAELGDMGKAAMPALSVLDQLKKDPDQNVRDLAKKVTDKILAAKI